MLWIDNAILFLGGFFAINGLLKGSQQEFFSLVVWLIALTVGWVFSKNFALLLVKSLPSPSVRMAASFASLVVITVLLGVMINFLLGEAVKKTGLNLWDRTGGLALGIVHGSIIVLAFVKFCGFTALPRDSWWQKSIYIPYFEGLIDKIVSWSF